MASRFQPRPFSPAVLSGQARLRHCSSPLPVRLPRQLAPASGFYFSLFGGTRVGASPTFCVLLLQARKPRFRRSLLPELAVATILVPRAYRRLSPSKNLMVVAGTLIRSTRLKRSAHPS